MSVALLAGACFVLALACVTAWQLGCCLGRAIVRRLGWERSRVTEQQGGHGEQPGTLTYRGDRLAYEPPRDGAKLGFKHPLGWPVRIVQGIPVAVGPDGRAAQWSRALMGWTHCYSDLAEEARSRLQLEETRADDSLPVAEPVCVSHGPNGATSVAEAREPLGPYILPGKHEFDLDHWCVNCGGGMAWAHHTGAPCFGYPGEAHRRRERCVVAKDLPKEDLLVSEPPKLGFPAGTKVIENPDGTVDIYLLNAELARQLKAGLLA